MALLTVGGEPHRLMIRTVRFSKRAQVAADTFGGESKTIKLADRAHLVAGIAIHCRMRADQGKTILMLVDVVNRNLPAVGVVAECALSAVFPPMQIRVAVLALHRRIAENESLMAIGALYFCVPSAQRKLRVRMVELQLGTERFPALGRMTLLALNLQSVAVWAVKWRIQRNVLSERNAPGA